MGWSNMFIDINKDSEDYSSLEQVENFIDHHNNINNFFSKEELNKLIETDELPGEELLLKILVQKTEDKDRYWAYLGNFGGCGHTFEWKEKYFPKIKMFHSGDFKFYNDGWTSWPIMTLEEFKNLKRFTK